MGAAGFRPRSRRVALGIVAAGLATGAVVAGILLTRSTGPQAASTVTHSVSRFDGSRAFEFLKWQVRLGPRPAGSAPSKRLAAAIRSSIPGGRFQPVPGGLRNVIGTVRGREPGRVVVVGSHYDTKDIPGFVGADDGASSTAVVRELARTMKPGQARSTLVFAFFDGEESPRGTPDRLFEQRGLRGSKVAARALGHANAMVLLDLVGDRDLSLPRELTSSRQLFDRLRAAARRVGTAAYFPSIDGPGLLDDHTPFKQAGVPAIDVIDFSFACWHQLCDNLRAVSPRSLDVVGETMVAFLESL